MSYAQAKYAEFLSECKPFFDNCTPLVYRRNSFRITGLQVDASERVAKRRIDDLKAAAELGDADDVCKHAFALKLTDAESVREADRKLRDPESRIVEEFFWFWPKKWSKWRRDTALDALSNGGKKIAFDIWSEEQSDKNAAVRIVARHNLAVMFHLVALDGENARLRGDLTTAQDEQISRYWSKAFELWETVSNDEAFWSLVSERIRVYDDPRLTTGFARRMRSALSRGMSKINGQLAMNYSERGRYQIANDHISYMKQICKDQDDFSIVISSVTEPLKARLRNAVEKATAHALTTPADGSESARQMLQTVEQSVKAIRVMLPKEDYARIDLCDSVAEACLECQLAFARESGEWGDGIENLEAAAGIAESNQVRARIEEGLFWARSAFYKDNILRVCDRALRSVAIQPESADREAQHLLSIAPEMFSKLDEFCRLPADRDDGRNRVASVAMECAIGFVKKTENWLTAIQILRRCLELARDPDLKDTIERNGAELWRWGIK